MKCAVVECAIMKAGFWKVSFCCKSLKLEMDDNAIRTQSFSEERLLENEKGSALGRFAW